MRKIYRILLLALCIPLTLHAHNTEQGLSHKKHVRNECKESAHERKEKLLSDTRANYVRESNTITSETKVGLEIVKWRILSSFRTESKKLLDEQQVKLRDLGEKTNKTKLAVHSTWKAEDALCELQYKKSKQ